MGWDVCWYCGIGRWWVLGFECWIYGGGRDDDNDDDDGGDIVVIVDDVVGEWWFLGYDDYGLDVGGDDFWWDGVVGVCGYIFVYKILM